MSNKTLQVHSIDTLISRWEREVNRSHEAIGEAKTQREIGVYIGRVEAFTEVLMDIRHNLSVKNEGKNEETRDAT